MYAVEKNIISMIITRFTICHIIIVTIYMQAYIIRSILYLMHICIKLM